MKNKLSSPDVVVRIRRPVVAVQIEQAVVRVLIVEVAAEVENDTVRIELGNRKQQPGHSADNPVGEKTPN